MKGKEINKNITVSGEGLTMWFEAMIKKYPNSLVQNHLKQVYRMMAGDSVFTKDSLENFFEKEFVGK